MGRVGRAECPGTIANTPRDRRGVGSSLAKREISCCDIKAPRADEARTIAPETILIPDYLPCMASEEFRQAFLAERQPRRVGPGEKVLHMYLSQYASRTADAQTERHARVPPLFDSSSISSSSSPFGENFSLSVSSQAFVARELANFRRRSPTCLHGA